MGYAHSTHRWTLLLLVFMLVPMASAERLSFIGVALDTETREADRRLADYLHRRAGIDFAPEELEYGQVIDRLTNWSDHEGHYVARMTPYVHVASEMLGARFETLATYVGASTDKRTYSSYIVVNRKPFSAAPDPDEFIRFVSNLSYRPKFVYHSKFSTSSFFLPSLFMRENSIYHMAESTESLIGISSEQVDGGSSTRLVKLVASGEADFAAVWDGSKNKFEPGHPAGLYEEFGSQVYFIQLPTRLPNDLLVCSANLDGKTKDSLRSAIADMAPEEIAVGDFQTWHTITEATDARLALADLRWKARERSSPVTVDVHFEHSGNRKQGQTLLDAIRQAVRLAGTELVLYDEDFHQHIDFSWTLTPIHDGAVMLTSSLPGSGIDDQVFRISFRDLNDLTRRGVSLIHSRLHRIRSVWPYSDETPLVIRDTAMSVAPGDAIKVQRITWIDPERNSFRAGPIFDSSIVNSGFFRYRLNASDFPVSGAFDAMSNISYRVFLLRSNEEKPIFRFVTLLFVALFVLAGLGAAIDLRRKTAPDPDSEKTRSFQST